MKSIKDYLTIKQAAEYLGVCEMTLRRWDKAGKLKAYRNPMSNYRLYKASELKSLLERISGKQIRKSFIPKTRSRLKKIEPVPFPLSLFKKEKE